MESNLKGNWNIEDKSGCWEHIQESD